MQKTKKKTQNVLKLLGPGLVTGAADDDPSGIVTYSQAGAQFGLGQLWVIFFTLPFMVAVQELCGRIGIVTGKGLSGIIKEHYSKKVLYFLVMLLLFANTLNLGADLGAMAEAVRLFVDVPFWIIATGFFCAILLLEIFLPYHKYAKILKWLTISLFAYIITGFIVVTNWGEVFRATLIPEIHFDSSFLIVVTAVLGTTISPYLFFWQTAQEVEEKNGYVLEKHAVPRISRKYISNMRLDTAAGMLFSNITAWFIIVTAGLVLSRNGVFEINSAAQAASALEPLVNHFPHSGLIAQALFAIGIIGTGLLAIPIFAASSAYAISEVFGWQEGLDNRFNQAKGFYTVIVVGTLAGLLMNFVGLDPIKALIYTAVINAIVAVPMILMIIEISNNKKIMGKYTSGWLSNTFSIIAFVAMALAAVFTIYTLFT